MLLNPCLIDFDAALADLDIVDALNRTDKVVGPAAHIVENVDMNRRATPADQLLQVGIGGHIQIVEIARAALHPAVNDPHDIAGVNNLKREGRRRLFVIYGCGLFLSIGNIRA